MKKLFRRLLCVTGLTVLLCTSAMAAGATDEIAIRFNGEPMTFTDAAPQIVNERTYLPFRTVFTALGFQDDAITYDDTSKTVCAQSEDLTISMVIGENKVTVTKDGQTTVQDTDVPAFIDPAVSRTYVPARFVAEAAEYRVGWNGDTRTVIIDDVDAILAANQESYKVLDLYLDYSRKYQNKNYQVEGAYSADMVLGADAMSVGGDYSMLMENNAKFDFETLMTMSGTVDGEDLAAAVPEGVDLELRGDLGSGVIYFKSNALTTLMEGGVENLWYKLDVGGMMNMMSAQTGMTYADLMGASSAMMSEMDGKTCIENIVRMAAQSDMTTSAADTLALCNALLSDSVFAKEGNEYVSQVEVDGMTMSMVVATKGGKAVGYGLSLYAADESTGNGMVLLMTMENDQLNASFILAADGMAMEMEMNGTYTATKAKPAGQPSDEAAVVDLLEWFGSMELEQPNA